jgi:TolB-like protein
VSGRNFFAELKRRNVYKVAAAYAVVAWLLIQLASILFPTFEAPPWVMKVFVATVALGFPIALILAWAFELTPEGIKRTDEVAPDESIRDRTGAKLIWATVAIACLALGLLLVGRPGSSRRGDSKQIATDKSIAVLPFVDMSAAKDQEYFCDGMSEELLDALSKVPGLRVIARTSSFSFKGKDVGVAEIGSKLGVATVLEGSLRREGNRIRVTAQLVNAKDGFHLWSNTFEREVQSVFAVQDEITRAIVDALRIKLGAAPVARVHGDSEAYDLYLQGLYHANRSSEADLRKALRLFEAAIAKDPQFARA